jgi:hypothetical protein
VKVVVVLALHLGDRDLLQPAKEEREERKEGGK